MLPLLSKEGDCLPVEGGFDYFSDFNTISGFFTYFSGFVTFYAGGERDADGPLLGFLLDFLEPCLGVACLLDFLECLLAFLEDLPEFFVV